VLDNPRAVAHIVAHFTSLRARLAARIEAKRAFIVGRRADASDTLDPRCLDVIAPGAGPVPQATAVRQAAAPLAFSYRLR
jgi:hypothetical protein